LIKRLRPNFDAAVPLGRQAELLDQQILHFTEEQFARLDDIEENDQILCRGGILPYYEFVGVSSYSDVEWKKRLDSDERPASPKWFKSIVAPGEPQIRTD